LLAHLLEVKCPGHGRKHQGGIADGGKRDEANTIGEVIEQLSHHRESQACFAHTACPGEGQQADLRAAQEGTGRHYLLLAPNQRGEWHGQVMP